MRLGRKSYSGQAEIACLFRDVRVSTRFKISLCDTRGGKIFLRSLPSFKIM